MRDRSFQLLRCAGAAVVVLALSVPPAAAQDPVQVASDLYKVVAENDLVRVLDVKIAAGQKAAMHSHPDLIAVVLKGGKIRWTGPDGKSVSSGADFKRGAVQVMNAEKHVSENIGTTTAHVILVEFKKPAPAAGKGRNPVLPAPFKQVADNAHARVFEGSVAAGGKVPEHTHGDHVIVSLADAVVELTDKDGTKHTNVLKKDTAQVGGPVTHSGVNTGKTTAHLIEIELK